MSGSDDYIERVMAGQDEQASEALRRLAGALRSQAERPVPTPLGKIYVEGFTDGMRVAADVAEAVADGRTTLERVSS